MKRLPTFLNTSERLVIAMVLIVLLAEFLIMLLISVFNERLSLGVWDIANPVLLAVLISPAFYILIFRPMHNQQHDLEELLSQLRCLMVRREEIREEERKYIAREVHDELGQILTGLQLNVSILDQKCTVHCSTSREHVKEILMLTDKALGVTRNVALVLRPVALDMGIVSALKWLAGRFGSNTGIQCEVHIEETEIQFEENLAIALFRILQESLTNVARHAGADTVEIMLGTEGDDYVLKVRDDGQGFDSSIKKKNSFGLVGIRERVIMLAGTVFINSRPGAGTEIVVRLPINNNSRKS